MVMLLLLMVLVLLMLGLLPWCRGFGDLGFGSLSRVELGGVERDGASRGWRPGVLPHLGDEGEGGFDVDVEVVAGVSVL